MSTGEIPNCGVVHRPNNNNADYSDRKVSALIKLTLVCGLTDFVHINFISQMYFVPPPHIHPPTWVQHTHQRWGCLLHSHRENLHWTTLLSTSLHSQKACKTTKVGVWRVVGYTEIIMHLGTQGLLWLILSVTWALSIHYLIEYKHPDYIKS